ncbi:MAG: TatD family hydrolase [Pseudomonadota bacterium]
MIVDSHCHLDRLNYNEEFPDLEAVMQHAKACDIGFMLCVAVTLEDVEGFKVLSQKYSNLAFSAGLHPLNEVPVEPSFGDFKQVASWDKVIAVGETGLDYYYDSVPKSLQIDRFKKQIQVARAIKKPLIVHTRDARADTIRVLQDEKAQEAGGVLHCFTESLDMAMEALELNFYISFSGISTFRNAADLREVIKALPIEKILVETDSPYLAPVPFRGKPCVPGYTKIVAEQVAASKGMKVEDVVKITTENFERLFDLKVTD